MTTIAAKFSILEIAADSMISGEDSFYLASKLRQGKNSIYGACGDWDKVLKAFQLLETSATEWESDLDVTILELRSDGIWVYENTIIPVHIKNDYWAVGTGANFAIAAMRLGLSPMEAIEISTEFDPFTSAPIESKKLGIKIGNKQKRHN